MSNRKRAGRVVLYSPEGSSLESMLSLHARAEAAGVVVTECGAGRSWSELLSELGDDDELVVGSLDCFASLNELLGFVYSGGVCLRSLDEPWFSAPMGDTREYLRRLCELGSFLHAARTRRGLDQAAQKGRKPGRKLGMVVQKSDDWSEVDMQVKQVDALRVEHRIPVVDACRRVGISVKSYYRKRML